MWALLITGLRLASAIHPDAYSSYPGRNQRIIKLHNSPYKHHPHHKHIRPGPLGPHVHYHDSHDHHYEYIRPNRPPPIPPFINNGPSSSSLKYHPRPPYHHYKSPPPYGSPYKPNSFRSPIIKDHFRSPPIPLAPVKPPISFEYLPSPKPSLNHIINSDDDRGPIHEIPAPNLGPKPDHHDHHQQHEHHEQYHHEQNSLFNSPSKEHSFSNLIKDTPVINFDKKPSYEVVETNDKVIQNPDGSKALFAPDPDPSLPAPKIPPTNDPHSSPSVKPTIENFPTGQEYQILEATPDFQHAPVPNLSSQELFDLMHSFPNDQYTVIQSSNVPQHLLSVLGPQIQYQNQPGLPQQQNFIQQSGSQSHIEVENNGIVHESAVNHHHENQQYHDFNNPQFQSFNYDERNHNAGAVPVDNFHGQFMFEPEASESENKGSVTVVRQTDEQTYKGNQQSVKQSLSDLPSELTNLIPDDDFEKELNSQDTSPIFKSNSDIPFYSSLPNKEAAEALATLQAAGSIATKIEKMRGDQSPHKESSEELVNFGLPKTELTKPQQIHAQESPSYDYEDEQEQQQPKTDDKTVEVQRSVPLFEASYKASSLVSENGQSDDEIITSLDVGQGAASEKFGRRIRPK